MSIVLITDLCSACSIEVVQYCMCDNFDYILKYYVLQFVLRLTTAIDNKLLYSPF